jgi:hypothetical protein
LNGALAPEELQTILAAIGDTQSLGLADRREEAPDGKPIRRDEAKELAKT